jgi:hypothetical protein
LGRAVEALPPVRGLRRPELRRDAVRSRRVCSHPRQAALRCQALAAVVLQQIGQGVAPAVVPVNRAAQHSRLQLLAARVVSRAA